MWFGESTALRPGGRRTNLLPGLPLNTCYWELEDLGYLIDTHALSSKSLWSVGGIGYHPYSSTITSEVPWQYSSNLDIFKLCLLQTDFRIFRTPTITLSSTPVIFEKISDASNARLATFPVLVLPAPVLACPLPNRVLLGIVFQPELFYWLLTLCLL